MCFIQLIKTSELRSYLIFNMFVLLLITYIIKLLLHCYNVNFKYNNHDLYNYQICYCVNLLLTIILSEDAKMCSTSE